MTPFIMSPEIEEQLQALRRLAEREDRRIPLDVMMAFAKDFDPEDPSTRKGSPYPLDQTVELPFGWKVSVAVERQPSGWFIHMSMSSPFKDGLPHPESVKMVLEALGFHRPLEQCMIYLERYEVGRTAVNVLELLDVSWKERMAN